jgi:hypothetical protein
VAGVATVLPIFTGFPMGPTVRSGSYDRTFDTEPAVAADTYNPAFVAANGGTVAAAEAVLFAGMLAGRTYFNIHTNQFPGGEIRGTLLATPEPGTLLLLAAGLAGVGVRTRTRRHAA